MLVVETIAKIRRAYFVDGRPIKAICRELGVSRKVVRKVIRSQATEFRYERETQPQPKMGPWNAELDRLLLANESKAARERLTLIRLFEELRGLGYVGGYDAVRRYARRWSQERGASTTSAYVPLSFSPVMKTFGVGKHSAKVTQTEANAIAALPVARRGPRLFNRVYGIGNPTKMREFGNTGPNDGWLYRGGGMMQCTGKSNYAKMAKKIGLPLVEHPELLHQPDSAFEVAYLDWAQDGRAIRTADAIPQNFKVNIAANRKVINGGTNGLAE